MMTNPTVPADVWACKQPGVPLVAAIVEGENRWTGVPGMDPDEVPPAWLVALRDARCETCWTLGVVMDNPDDLYYSDELEAFTVDGDVRTKPCPDCHNGRLLHDVRVECGTSVEWPDGGIGLCDLCFGTGYRTVRCLVDVVPVVDSGWNGQDYAWPDTDALMFDGLDLVLTPPFLFTAADEMTHTLTPAHVEALAAACGKPPADWVGMYAGILTEVGE